MSDIHVICSNIRSLVLSRDKYGMCYYSSLFLIMVTHRES